MNVPEQTSLLRDQESYIAGVPTEILEEIFAFCMTWFFEKNRVRNRMAWAQACRSWHQISLNSARLWSSVDLTNVKFAECALRRSRESPIAIYSRIPAYFLPNGITMQGYRVQRIDVCLFPDDMERLFSILGPCYSLESLTLTMPVIVRSTFYLNVDCSGIRHLHLASVAVPWETCTNLMSLTLRRIGKERAPSIESLQGIIDRSPHLISCQLVDVQLKVSEDCDITTSYGQGAHLYVHIATNAAAVVETLSALSKDCHSVLTSGTPEVVKLQVNDRNATFFVDDSRPWSDTGESIILSVTISAPPSTTFLDISHLSVLEIGKGALTQMSLGDVGCLLISVPRLETLRIAPKNALSEILELLTATPTRTLCPTLSSISFGYKEEYWRNFSGDNLVKVIACLRSRSLSGYALESVAFIKCEGIASASAEALFTTLVKKLDIIGQASRGNQHTHLYSYVMN